MYSLSVGSHTEKHTSSYTGSDGKTHHSTTTYHILDVHVTTKSLLEIANENARPAGDDGKAYSNVFDTPFGYLTKAQEDSYDVLQEVGPYTTLEEIDNPFADPNSDTDPTWSVARRYGYYIDLPAGNYHPKENKGLYISAQVGDAVYAGFSGEATVDGDAESSSRKITYENLSSIPISSGDQISAGVQIGSVGDNSDLPSPTLYVAYSRNGKELNPRFYIQGCLYGNSSGTGNGDIVQTALSQYGTLETPVNQVMTGSMDPMYPARLILGAQPLSVGVLIRMVLLLQVSFPVQRVAPLIEISTLPEVYFIEQILAMYQRPVTLYYSPPLTILWVALILVLLYRVMVLRCILWRVTPAPVVALIPMAAVYGQNRTLSLPVHRHLVSGDTVRQHILRVPVQLRNLQLVQ